MSRTYVSYGLRRIVRIDARARCGYCHAPEAFLGMPLDIEHILPEASGGQTLRENLWMACSRCNDFKGDRVDGKDPDTDERCSLFNPRTQMWREHFAWSLDGVRIEGRTAVGRTTVETLRLNNEFILVARQLWVEAGRWPPPDDLPSGAMPSP
jgi:hypothetical protein